ncbi:MAG: hypothetical protein ACRD1Y_00845 [Terriglobales bacterium]
MLTPADTGIAAFAGSAAWAWRRQALAEKEKRGEIAWVPRERSRWRRLGRWMAWQVANARGIEGSDVD